MLREGLGTEFPSAKRALGYLMAALREPRVASEAPPWAAVSAFGATWVVITIGAVLAAGLRMTGQRDPASWVSGAFAIAGYAAAIAVALRSGGRRGLAWYLGIVVIRIAVQVGSALPGFLTFCERSGDCAPLRLVVPYVYLAAGFAACIPAIVLVRSGPPRANALLNGAGALSLLGALTAPVFLLAAPQDPVSAGALDLGLTGGAAFGAGVVMRLRSPRRLPAVALAGALAVTWLLLTGPFIVSMVRDGGGSQPAAVYISGMTQGLALAIGWLAADAGQRARTTAAA